MQPFDVYNMDGKPVGKHELPPQLFGVPVKPELVQQAVVALMANARQPVAHTKHRGEVRGGGRKPWRQKGTGRARHGSIRSPLWKGGGVTFGPRNTRNVSLGINAKAKRKALLMALSAKADSRNIILLDSLRLPQPKTKAFVAFLARLPFPKGKSWPSTLTILPASSPEVIRASRNLPRVSTIRADSLNVVDVVRHEYLLMPVGALALIERTFRPKPQREDEK